MNKPRMAANPMEAPIDLNPVGEFSFDYIEDMLNEADSGDSKKNGSHQPQQYRVFVKRNDGLYRTLHVLNNLFSILGVLLIMAIFGMVFYGLVTITEVAEIVSQIEEHNTIKSPSPSPLP